MEKTQPVKTSYRVLRKQHQPYVYCSTCSQRAYETRWLPPHGYNPNLREYFCEWGHLTYTERKEG